MRRRHLVCRLGATLTRKSLLRSASLAAALTLAGCLRDSTGPARPQVAELAVLPVFETRSALAVPFNQVRITLSRQSGIARDTTVGFPAGADSLVLTVPVTIYGASETLTLNLWMINVVGAARDTMFHGGPIQVTAASGAINRGAPVAVAVRYVGLGSNARSVVIATHPASLFFRDSLQLTAAALDSSGQPIPGTPIVWQSLDPTLATVPADSTGRVVAGVARGLARIQALLLTGQADTARVSVQPVPVALGLVSGSGQTGAIGALLSQPLVARVKAADSLGVQNVYVHFVVTSGGGKASADSVLTDATGAASVQWTLGVAAGTQTLQASVPGVSGATVTYAATALAGTAASLAFSVQPAAAVAGTAIAPAVVVAARDSVGNTATGFTGNVTLAITGGTGKAGATLRGTTTVAAVGGLATFSSVNVDSVGTGYTLTASATGPTSAVSSAFAVVAGAAAALAFTVQPPASTAYQTPFGFTVTARDAVGNTATSFSGAVTIAIGTNPAGGTLSGTTTANAVAGVAAFSGISLDNIGSGYTLSATATGLTGTSAAFNIVAPPNVNAWINTGGGNWSVAANWSKGTVPVATDTVAIKQSGTYTVNLDANGTFARLDVGAPLGAQTLSVAANTLTAGNGAFSTRGTLALSGTGTVAGTGTLSIAGAFNWTGGTLGGNGGTTQVLAGGTLAVSPTANVTLQNHTLEVDGTGTWTGTASITAGNSGTLRVGAGGILNVTGAPTITLGAGAALLDNLGTINRTTSTAAFAVNVPIGSGGAWNVQSGTLTLQGGGTTSGAFSVASGATMLFQTGTFTFSTASSVTGAGTVNLVSGTVGFAGGYSVTGATSVAGATANFTGSGQTLAALTLSSGALGSSGTLTVTGATTWSGGSLSVTGGSLTLAGGSGAAFGGTATVGSANALGLGGGTFTLTTNLNVTGGGALNVTGGSLVLNGHAAILAGNLVTSGTGALTMTNAADSVNIAGNASFGGGLGTMNAGVIRLAGNFVQTGAANFQGTAQSAAVAHRVVLNGASGTQTISFADPTTSYFRRLWIAKGAGSGVTILTDVRTTYFAQTTGTTGFTGSAGPPMTRLIADTIAGIGGGSNLTSPLVIQLGGVSGTAGIFTDSGLVNVDTVIFAGAGQNIPISTGPGSIQYKSIRVAQTSGTATFGQSTSLANDLVVSSGTLSTGGHIVTVTGNFQTQSAGVLSMTAAADSLRVTGNVTFGGGSSALSAGVITTGGSFAQTTNATAFVASGAQHTVLNGSGAQNLSFANPTTSFFRRLEIPAITHNVVLQTNVQVTDSLTMFGGGGAATMTGAGTSQRLIIGGLLTIQLSTLTPRLAAPVVELSVTPAIATLANTFNPDTTVFNGSIAALPTGTGIGYKSVRVNTTGALSAPGGNVTFNGNLVVSSGTYAASAGVDSVQGFLRTEGTGALSMTGTVAAPTIIVRDSAVFGGGASTSLSAGLLAIGGSFVQRTTAAAFQATSGHTTNFNGSGTQTVTFANPGPSASTFGNLFIGRASGGLSQPTGITLGSNIFVAGTIQDSSTNAAANDSIAGGGFAATAAGGISTGSQFVMNNALLVLNNFTTFNTSGLTFRNMNPAATYLTLNRNTAGSNSVSGINFATPVTSGVGKYFSLNTGAVTYSWTVTSSLPAASSMTGNYVKTGSPLPTVTWNGTALP